MRDLHRPGRSMVWGTGGVCATSQPLASLAATRVMADGGNAADAAVAAAAVLAVVEPMGTGIGGDCFVLAARPGGATVGINGSGRSPQGLSLEVVGGKPIEQGQAHAVTIPGAVDAWVKLLADYGTMEIGRVLETAIALAQDGFAVSPRIALEWHQLAGTIAGCPHYLPLGRAPEAGSVHRLPALAEALGMIGAKGREGFYAGAVMQDMLDTLAARGGVHREEDFAAHSSEVVHPLRGWYQGKEVLELPPNGQGITALVLLNMLRCCGHLPLEGAARWHVLIEAARLAYGVRDKYVGDGAEVAHLLEEETARRLVAEIDPHRARTSLPLPPLTGGDTVYVAAVDRDGFLVSLINSIYHGFGSGIVSERYGICLQSRGTGFSGVLGHPNVLEGGKRPLNTIIPGLLLDERGRGSMAFGVMGGDYQPLGHATVLSHMLDGGMDAQEALDAPRLFPMGRKVVVERGMPQDVLAGLSAMGHTLTVADMPLGGGQIVGIDHEKGSFYGASDPRKDGAAIAF